MLLFISNDKSILGKTISTYISTLYNQTEGDAANNIEMLCEIWTRMICLQGPYYTVTLGGYWNS